MMIILTDLISIIKRKPQWNIKSPEEYLFRREAVLKWDTTIEENLVHVWVTTGHYFLAILHSKSTLVHKPGVISHKFNLASNFTLWLDNSE